MKKKNFPYPYLTFRQRRVEERKKFLFSAVLVIAVILFLIFFVKWFWFSDISSHTKKIAEPVLDAVVILDSLEGDNISQWANDVPIINDLGTYLSAGVSAVDSIRKSPILFFKRGIDVLTGRVKIDTIVDTVYVVEVVVEESFKTITETNKKEKRKTVKATVREGEWSADNVRTKLKKAGKYSKSAERYISYIEKYRDEAVWHEEEYEIPASIKMAQALLESNAGRSTLARIANNHFGKKCRCNEVWKTIKGKDGKKKKILVSRTFSHTSYASGCKQKKDDYWYDQFEFYSSLAKSWEAHSALLKGSKGKGLYRSLFKYDDPTKVYAVPQAWQVYLKGKKQGSRNELWAAGLKACGYATHEDYATILISIMNTYELDLL